MNCRFDELPPHPNYPQDIKNLTKAENVTLQVISEAFKQHFQNFMLSVIPNDTQNNSLVNLVKYLKKTFLFLFSL